MFENKIGTWKIIGFFRNILLAHDSDSPTPYVTWIFNRNGVESGHYFNTEEEAIQDFLERAGYGS